MPGVLTLVADQFLSLLTMAVLLVFSGFFSGSETALFSLTGHERLALREGRSKVGRLAERLLRSPQSLLLTILFANLMVNVLIFTISSVVAYRLAKEHHHLAAGAVGVLTLLVVVLFGEILPKATAYYLRTSISKLSAPPLWLVSRVFQPVLTLVRLVIVDPAVRILTGPTGDQQIQKQQLLELLAGFSQEKLIAPDQAHLLANVIELRDLRVRQIMTPRVDLICCDIDDGMDELTRASRNSRPCVVLVYRRIVDNVQGIVRSRRFGLQGPGMISDVLEPADFVPEQQRVDHLIRHFTEKHTDVAVVIDEYGGLAGMVRMVDVLEELLGKLVSSPSVSREPKLSAVRPGHYLTDASFEIDQFCERFDVPAPEIAVTTVGGLLMSLVGHLPSPGEHVRYHHLVLEASTVCGSKIKEVLIMERRRRR